MKFKVEDARRRAEIEKTMGRTTDGPAHKISEKIFQMKRLEDEATQNKFVGKEDPLNKQLLTSEDSAKYRASVDGKNLAEHWERMLNIKRSEQQKLEAKNKQVGLVLLFLLR